MNVSLKPKTPIVKSWLQDTTRQLKTHHIASARLDAEIVLAHVLCVDRLWLVSHDDTLLSSSQLQQADSLIERRIKREPIAYIVGKKEFYGRDFIVTPDVLIPRPETEAIIELAKQLQLPNNSYVIDVGTGSGIIGLTLKAEITSIRDVVLVDISRKALDIAKQNNGNLFHFTGVQYYQSDLLSFWLSSPDQGAPYADLILANLPYVDTTWEISPELAYEPQDALYAEDGGLALIKRLITQSKTVIKDGGYLLLEADPAQHEAILEYSQPDFTQVKNSGYCLALQRHRAV